MVGLESVQTQLSALMARNDDEAATMVREMLAELQRPRAVRAMERLVRAWEAHDLQELEAYAEWCDCLNTPTERDTYHRLVDGRNPGLADSSEALHGRMSVFAAVGALHVVGPQGLTLEEVVYPADADLARPRPAQRLLQRSCSHGAGRRCMHLSHPGWCLRQGDPPVRQWQNWQCRACCGAPPASTAQTPVALHVVLYAGQCPMHRPPYRLRARQRGPAWKGQFLGS